MKTSNQEHRLHTVLVLVLFLIFSLSAVSVLTYGTRVYKSIIEKTEENYSLRTGLIYLSNKIKSADEDRIYIDQSQKVTMLVIPEDIEGKTYESRIYCYNGKLMEIFTNEGNDIPLEGGLYITDMDSLTIEETKSGLIEIEATYENLGTKRLIVDVRGAD